jgi:putative DNA primase/helicase
MEAAKVKREAERELLHAECREWCSSKWEKSRDASDDHPYLRKKGVHAYRLKILKDALMVPLRDMAGTLHGIQFINPDGSKRFKTGTNKAGHFHKLGSTKDSIIVVCEGFATGSSIFQSTGHCTLVAFDSGNLKAVAEAVRAKRPDYKIILAADNDQSTDGNPGLTKAMEAARAVNGLVAVPEFRDVSSKPTDFNDLHTLEGLDRVREIIETAISAGTILGKQTPAMSTPSDTRFATSKKDKPAGAEASPAVNWPEPLLFGEVSTPEIPAELLPGFLGDFCKAVSEATQTPPGLAVMFALAVVATCLQRRFKVSVYPDYSEPLSLWTVTALPPGSRKTAVKSALTAPLLEWEHQKASELKPDIKRVTHVRSINKRLIEQLQARASKTDTTEAGREELLKEIMRVEDETPEELISPRLFVDDVTVERLQNLLVDHGGRMTLLSDEGGCFEVMSGLYSGGRVNLNVFLQAHAGAAIRVDRQGRTVCINEPALSIGVTVQPDIIADLGSGCKARFRGNGTLARFFFCIPKSNIGTRDVTKRIVISAEIKEAYRAGIMGLLAIEPELDNREHEKPRMLTLSPEALSAYHAFSQFIEDRQGENGEFNSFSDWTSKLPGAGLRIAGLFHVVEHGDGQRVISVETVERAYDLCELLISHARAAFDVIGSDPAQVDAQAVLRWIVATGKTTFRQNEAQKTLRQFRTVDRLESALKVLTGRYIISEPRKRSSGGRPAIVYAVNPAVLPGVRGNE